MANEAKLSYKLYRQQRGELSSLSTSVKTNLVGAINEVKATSAPSSHVGSTGETQHALADGTNAGFSQNNFTQAEKTKLASLEGSHFRGEYPSSFAFSTSV